MATSCSAAENKLSGVPRYVIGLDFGTESLRALLVNVDTGEEVADAVSQYKHGVIDEFLPESGVRLEMDWALQHPGDYIKAMHEVIPSVLRKGQVNGEAVIGIGVDFTSCTILPTRHDGTPLCFIEDFKDNPHAWVKLWKHHAAQPEADLINQVASERGEGFLKYYGGKISSEWALPKLLQILREAPEVYRATDRFVEAGDWVVWYLTGKEWRSACAAGYKALWNHEDGYPSRDFLKALDPAFEGAVDEKLKGPILAPGRKAGNLRPEIARVLGLSERVVVAAPIIDAHAGVLGCGVASPGKMVMVMGTSSCQLVMSREPRFFKGPAGIVKDGILPGYYGYEYGQPAVGDIFSWFIDNCVPHQYYEEAQSRGISLHALFEEKTSRLSPGESGLVALDWHNGNRSVLMDASLKGVVIGYTLKTKAEEVYRALVEATAFGARKITETHEAGAGPIQEVFACGGLTKNRTLMQIYSDILGRPISVASSSQPVALGAAVLGALAAGVGQGGYDNVAEVVSTIVAGASEVYRPDKEKREMYDELYHVYERYHDCFGICKAIRGEQGRDH
ncbi:MAG: ribulokinase [Bacillota bacterium]